jgi:hypothetical protein
MQAGGTGWSRGGLWCREPGRLDARCLAGHWMRGSAMVGREVDRVEKRKPAGMSVEGWVDRRVREGIEAGEFDEL